MAFGVGARCRRLAVRRHQRRDLRQGREIRRDLRSLGRRCQHLATRIDQISESGLADLRVAQEVGEETKIDFGDGDAGIEAGMRHRDRHIRSRIGEIGRLVADAAGNGFGKSAVPRKIHVAADRNRGARQPKLLAALAVELRELTDSGHLVQQLRIVGTALLERHDAGAGNPADLALQLRDRLLDPLRRRLRLFRHGVGERGLGRAVADPRFHGAVDGEHEHDEADQRDDVFGEQALAQEPDFILDPDHPDPRAHTQQIAAAAPISAAAASIWPSRPEPV